MWKVVAAAVLWGTAGTAGLLITADPISVAAARLVIGGVVLAVLARGTRVELRPGLLLAALAVAAYQLCFFAAVSRTGVAVGTVVAIGSGPVFTGLLSWLLHGQRPSRRWAAATAAAIAGCAALLLGAGGDGGDGGAVGGAGGGGGDHAVGLNAAAAEDLAGIGLALLGGLIYAFYAVMAARHIGAGADSNAVMGVMFGGAAVVMLPVLLWTGPGWIVEPRSLLGALYLGLGTTALAYFLYGKGLRTTPVATAATLALAEPGVAALLGLLVLHESLTALSVAGLLLLGASLVAVAVPERKSGEEPRAEAGVSGQRAG
ncbi:EamA family transporter [Nonomuraea soli]|uniref:DME family drug/metabolite transporter n=1 Tax=Nonomuraea soli TaxID=1032476 RepID=A0A7W0CVK5_9ACTN|nr:EamA family transporter [Nonomuraea soli]MBA2897948.1 DME family drug/metabolite transporter [Nonomuraea soli]